jgi:hypothetical protein
MVRGQPWQKVSDTPSQPKKQKKKELGVMLHTCHPGYPGSMVVQASLCINIGTLSEKYLKQKGLK